MNLNLETERLLLRPLAESDLDIAIAILADPEVMWFVVEPTPPETVTEQMPTFVRRGGGGCIGIWCVVEKATGDKLGTGILLPLPIEEEDTDWSLVGGPGLPDREIEVGYLLKKSAWGKGYATEIAGRLLRFAFEETPLEEVVAVIDDRNEASRRVLKKCGMIEEGPRPAYATMAPGFRLTRAQWLEMNSKASG